MVTGFYLLTATLLVGLASGCELKFRARFADADASTTVLSQPITRTEYEFVLEYQTNHLTNEWLALRWDQLSPVHTSRAHLAVLSHDKDNFIHVHPEDFVVGDANPISDSDTSIKVKLQFPSAQKYAVVLDWTVLVDSLTSTCTELDDVLYYNGSNKKLAEAHQLLTINILGDGQADSRPIMEEATNPKRLRRFMLREWNTEHFMNLALDEGFCCNDENKEECVQAHLVHEDSPYPSLALTDQEAELNSVRVIPTNQCISFSLAFQDLSTGEPADLSPILEAAAHVLVVNEDLSVGIHLHEVAPGARLKPEQGEDECPHGDKVMAKGPNDQLGPKVEVGALLPHAGIWTIFATTSYMDKVIVSKFEVLVADSEDQMKSEKCLDIQPECEADLSCEDYLEFRSHINWLWEEEVELYEEGSIGSLVGYQYRVWLILVPSVIVAVLIVYWCRTTIAWVLCCNPKIMVERNASECDEEGDLENNGRKRRNSLTVVTEAITKHRRNSEGYFEPLEAKPDTPGGRSTSGGNSPSISPCKETSSRRNRRSTLAVTDDATTELILNRREKSDPPMESTSPEDTAVGRGEGGRRRSRRRRSISEAVVDVITRQQRHRQGYLNPSEDSELAAPGDGDEGDHEQELSESLDWIARV